MERPPPPWPVKVVCPSCGATHLIYDGPKTFPCRCGQLLSVPPKKTGTK